MTITGHKSEQSLADYNTLDIEDRRKLGKTLGGVVEPQSMLTLAPAAECSTPKPSFNPNPAPFIFQNCTFNNCLAHAHHHTHSRHAINSTITSQKACLHTILNLTDICPHTSTKHSSSTCKVSVLFYVSLFKSKKYPLLYMTASVSNIYTIMKSFMHYIFTT